jgi:SecDF, P1 head subdomain
MTGRDDLEGLLRGFLAARAPSPQPGVLEASIRQTAGLPQRHQGRMVAGFGWPVVGAATAVALIVAVVVFGSGLVPRPIAPGTHATPSPTPEPAPSATTISLPVSVQEKAIAEQAEAVFALRLQALGIGNIAASIGNDLRFTFIIPPSVDPADVVAVLHIAGRIEWLAWPDGAPTPNVGDPVPDNVLPLFDAASQITSVKLTTGHSVPPVSEVELTLGPVAMQALATYTSSHVGKPLPLALDGRILTAPVIESPITAGDLIITSPSVPDAGGLSAAALAAILKSGPVPDGWTVP